jgi:hypothetical protein
MTRAPNPTLQRTPKAFGVAHLVHIRPMRALLMLLATAIVSSASSPQIDGVPVRGRIQDVSVADIREAIRAVQEKVSRVEVLNADRMHVYFKASDLGWIAVKRAEFAGLPIDRTHPEWWSDGRGIDDPEVSQFMRTANELYVFPVMTPGEPRRDRKRMRLLDSSARSRLVSLLADHRNWYQGGYTLVLVKAEPRNIGILLRSGQSELVLFFSGSFTSSAGHIEGAFNGQHVSDTLEDVPGKKLDEWSRRYAQRELGPTNKSRGKRKGSATA